MLYLCMFYQPNTEHKVMMIPLIPAQENNNCVKHGLFSVDRDLHSWLTQQNFIDILLTNATMEDGEVEVAKYFKVNKQLDELLDQWHQEGTVVNGFKWFYDLLFLVKSTSKVDHIWFSFFEGMHCHTAIVTDLVCSKFNHLTSKLEPGLLTLEAFKNGDIKSFEDPNTTVSEHLDQIMPGDFDVPMVQDPVHLSAYVPKNDMNAAELIEATRLQSVWISNFKRTSASTSISKVLVNWFENTLQHSSTDTRRNPSYRPLLANGHSMYYQ
jgi:hypothetical protein